MAAFCGLDRRSKPLPPGYAGLWARLPPYYWPSYDVVKLAQALVSRVPGRTLSEVRFYTGVPSESQNADWHGFWNNKLRRLQRQGVRVYRQELSAAGQEKGVDVRFGSIPVGGRIVR